MIPTLIPTNPKARDDPKNRYQRGTGFVTSDRLDITTPQAVTACYRVTKRLHLHILTAR